MKKLFTFLCCIMFSFLFMVGTGYAEESNPIKVGTLFVMSGKLGGYGKSGWQAVQLAIDEINQNGGLLGRKIEAFNEDTKADPETGKSIARRYMMQENVDFIIGPTASSVGLAVNDACQRGKTIQINSQSATHVMSGEEFSPYTFNVLSNTILQSRAGAYYLQEKGYKEWMALVPDYSYGHSSWKQFSAKMKELDPDAKMGEKLAPKLMTNDYTPYIKKILNKNPDAVWCPLWGGDAVTFIKQANQFDLFDKVKFAFPVGASMEVLVPLAEQVPDGIHMSARYFFTQPDSAMNNEFVKKYHERYDEYPSYMAEESYAAVKFLEAAVKRAGTTDTDAIIEAVESEPLAFETPEGWKIMNPISHQVIEDVIWGDTAYSEKYGFSIIKDVRSIQAEQITRTPEELEDVKQYDPRR